MDRGDDRPMMVMWRFGGEGGTICWGWSASRWRR